MNDKPYDVTPRDEATELQPVDAQRRTRTYFLSDLHLGATFMPDEREHERHVIDMLKMMERDARTIYLMGDVLDYWFEYRTVVPRGHVRFFGQLARMADAGIKIYWFIGNHDIWLFDYLSDELGVTVIDGTAVHEIDGVKFFLGHGDGLGDKSRSFRFLRRLFRNRVCQKLFSGIHPRWTVPFAYRWSHHSRMARGGGIAQYRGDDQEPQMIYACRYAADHPDVKFYIMGHRHVLAQRPVGQDATFVLLGDCFRQYTYGVWDGKNFSIEHFDIKA